MSEKILTIAIPTYNRANFLNICLNEIYKQINDYRNDIHLIVSDNASTDNTSDIVNSYIKKGMQIEYVKNSQNIGADRNFINCLNMTRTKYMLVFGDDDIFIANAFKKIIPILKKYDCGILNLGGYGFRTNFKREQRPPNENRIIFYTDKHKFVQKINIQLTFISANIFQKKLMNKKIQPEKLFNTNLVQLSWIMPIIDNSSLNILLDSHTIGARIDNTGGYRFCEVFGRNFQKIANYMRKNGVSYNLFTNVQHQSQKWYFADMILNIRKKKHLKFHSEDFLAMLYPIFKKNPFFWLLTFPAIKFPLFIARFYFNAYNKLLKIIKILTKFSVI
jgi:glycosyltransferase involved in cell wall biosynthesis